MAGNGNKLGLAASWIWACGMLWIADATAETSTPALLAEGLRLDAQAHAREGVTDADGRFAILIGAGDSGLQLRTITIRIDEQITRRYEYSDIESRALAGHALHALMPITLASGTHTLRADFAASAADAKPGDPRHHGQLESSFNSGATSSGLILELAKSGFTGRLTMQVTPFDAVANVQERQLRTADFLIADHRYFQAASQLMRFAAAQPQATASAEFNRQLSTCLQALAISAAPAPQDNLAASGGGALSARYNRAVDQIAHGDAAEGRAALDAIGKAEATDATAWAMRDQANLVLGYDLLRHSEGPAAVAALGRVRSPGPSANPALLGLGWALLAPSGVKLDQPAATTTRRLPTIFTPRLTADIAAIRRQQAPRVPQSSKEQQTALRNALVPWTELTGRDPTDPAVQEGMLAIAWSLYHFGAYAQAQDDYLRAVDQFEKTRGWLDAAARHVRSGGMVQMIAAHDNDAESGWHWTAADLAPAQTHWWFGDTPAAPRNVVAGFYLDHLMQLDAFADTLQRYNDLRELQAMLAQHLAKPPDDGDSLRAQIVALQATVEQAIAGQRGALEEIAIAELSRQRQQVERYLVEARFALASIYDRPVAAAGMP